MPTPSFQTLSQHLLHEARKYCGYPEKSFRTPRNQDFRAIWDDFLRRFIEWRKTFMPQAIMAPGHRFPARLIDECYSRQQLEMVPAMVKRTEDLSDKVLVNVPDISLPYLREAANCYVAGYPNATVALSRTAVELPLRNALASRMGDKAVSRADLFVLVKDFAARTRLLSSDGVNRIHKIRLCANRALHEESAPDLAEALDVFESARLVVMELAGK